MIPTDFIVEWRARTRWATDEQVEQDLVLSRALVAIFDDPELAGALALRDGTALHNLRQPTFTGDVPILLPPGTDFDMAAAGDRVFAEILSLLPSDPWANPRERRPPR